MSSTWPSYRSGWVPSSFCWHLVVETSSLTVRKSKYELQYCWLRMWTHGGTQCCTCLSKSTDFNNLTAYGFRIQQTVMTSHSSLHMINEPSSSISRMFNCYSSTRYCGSQKSIRLLRIMVSLCTVICLNWWMAWCELLLRWWLNGRKTYTSPWHLCSRSCPHIMLKKLQSWVCFTFRWTFMIPSRSRNHVGSWAVEWNSILRTWLSILPTTRSHFQSMWRINTTWKIEVYATINPRIIPSNNFCPSAIVFKSVQYSHDQYDMSTNDEEYFMPNNMAETTPRRSYYASL